MFVHTQISWLLCRWFVPRQWWEDAKKLADEAMAEREAFARECSNAKSAADTARQEISRLEAALTRTMAAKDVVLVERDDLRKRLDTALKNIATIAHQRDGYLVERNRNADTIGGLAAERDQLTAKLSEALSNARACEGTANFWKSQNEHHEQELRDMDARLKELRLLLRGHMGKRKAVRRGK